MRITPLGDQALLVHLPNEDAAFALADSIRRNDFSWIIDMVQSYASVALFLDPARIDYQQARDLIARLGLGTKAAPPGRLHRIPCCYEFELDLGRVADFTALSGEQVIAAHLAAEYTIYAIGFCPGFPYLGFLPRILDGVPRLPEPRLRVEAGSVGMTGRQTGIYTEPRPGGWNLIGRTPMVLVDVATQYFPMRVGDRVRFKRIDEHEFRKLKGARLATENSSP